MLDPKKIDPTRMYLNIESGMTATGETMLEEIEHNRVDLSKWVDRDDAGKGRKYDTGKPDWSLVPADEIEDVVKVFTMGAEKYGRENWKSVENGMFRYFAAMMRHIKKYKKYLETGDEELLYDDESGLHHLSHAMTNAVFLMWLDNNRAHTFKDGDMPVWWDQMERAAEFELEQMILADADRQAIELGKGLSEDYASFVDAPKDQNPYLGKWPDDANYVVNFNMEND